jgi:hypothetical protein
MTSSNHNDNIEYGVNGNQSGLVQDRFQFHTTENHSAAIQTGGQPQNVNSSAVPLERGKLGGKTIKIKPKLFQCPIALALIKMMANVMKILKSDNRTCEYELIPVKTIKNIHKCDVYIKMTKHYMAIQIDPKHICDCEDTAFSFQICGGSSHIKLNPKWCDVELAMSFEELLKVARRLKFSKFTGQFYDPENETCVAEIENDELFVAAGLAECDTCCVCSDMTQTKTECGHTLCHECWNSLDKHICPMCRGELTTRQPDIADDQ